MTEVIINQEDRQFTSSIGNWTGEIDWEPGPIKGREGLMHFKCPITQDLIHAYLNYPHMKVPKNLTASLEFLITQLEAPTPGLDSLWYYYDGVNTVLPYYHSIFPIGLWLRHYMLYNMPPTWNKANGKIILWIKNEGAAEKNFYLDNISGYYEAPPKIQYLPLIGVG